MKKMKKIGYKNVGDQCAGIFKEMGGSMVHPIKNLPYLTCSRPTINLPRRLICEFVLIVAYVSGSCCSNLQHACNTGANTHTNIR